MGSPAMVLRQPDLEPARFAAQQVGDVGAGGQQTLVEVEVVRDLAHESGADRHRGRAEPGRPCRRGEAASPPAPGRAHGRWRRGSPWRPRSPGGARRRRACCWSSWRLRGGRCAMARRARSERTCASGPVDWRGAAVPPGRHLLGHAPERPVSLRTSPIFHQSSSGTTCLRRTRQHLGALLEGPGRGGRAPRAARVSTPGSSSRWATSRRHR